MTGAAAGQEEEEGRAAAVEWLCSQRQCGGGSGGKVAEAVVPVGDGDGGVGGFGGKTRRSSFMRHLSLVRGVGSLHGDRWESEEDG